MTETKKAAPGQPNSFLLSIHFRQNATWQGTVHWLDGKKTRHFRSVLELAALMQEAMDSSGGVQMQEKACKVNQNIK